MIKLILANEVEEPERTVKFELRRHLSPPSDTELYLVGLELGGSNKYPVKIDGLSKEIRVRRSAVENLGFKLVVED